MVSTLSPEFADPSPCSTFKTPGANDATMPRPAELVAGVEPRLNVQEILGWLAELITGQSSSTSPLINSSSVSFEAAPRGFLSPTVALFFVWQSLRRQAAIIRTMPTNWDSGFCSRISLIFAGTQNRALDLQRRNGGPRLVPGETCTEAGEALQENSDETQLT